MRKVSGILLAAAIMLPAGVMTAAPAGAAGGLTCSTLGGTATFTPPVPAAPKKAKSNILLKATFSKCGGTPGVTSGAVKLPLYKGQTAGNCTTLATKPTKITVPKGGTVTWNKGAKSTLGPVAITPAGLATYKAVVKVTAGQFQNKTITLTSVFKPNGCPITSASLSLKSGTKIVLK